MKKMKTILIASIWVATALAPLQAHAKKAHAKAGTAAEPKPTEEAISAPPALMSTDPYVAQPIDQLMDRLRSGDQASSTKKKSKKRASPKPRINKTLAQLSKAYEAFGDGKVGEAFQLASGLEKNKEYGDYALWITGRALQAQAAIDWSEDKNAAASKSAASAVAQFQRLIEKYPYSPHFKFAGRELGRSQLVLGATQCGQKNWGPCKSSMHEGLQRLAISNDLLSIEPEILEAYGNACSKETDDLCRSWIYRLSQTFHRGSAELKALSKHAGGIIESLPSPSISGKITKNYRAPDADQVSFDAAMVLYLDQRYSSAQKAFREFLDTYPRSGYRYRARYWLAQSFIQDQKADEGHKMLETLSKDTPLTYYGLLAAVGTGKSMESFISATTPLAQTRDPYLHPWELYRLGRGEKMIQSRAYSLAAIELKEIRHREPLSNSFLLYLAAIQDECGNHSTSFTILSDLISRNFDGVMTSYVVRMIFPSPYMELIEKQARDSKLDPLLVLSLIKQESAFDLGANSSTGARGLMQIMPTTFTDVIPETRHGDMAKLELNLKAGTKYLAKMLNRYNGNLVLALAAYNAGPGNADKWLRASPPKRHMFEFIEAIPFKETREYVAAIMRNYFWYSRRLRNETPNLAMFWTTPTSAITNNTGAGAPSPGGGLEMPLQLPMPLPSPSPVAPEPVGPQPIDEG